MTEYDDFIEHTSWNPKTPRSERLALREAPLATLTATPHSEQARALKDELARRYPRLKTTNGKAYAPREKSLADHATACAAFVADLLDALRRDRSEGWLRCSQRKTDYTDQFVTWRVFDGVQTSWLEAGLLDHKPGYDGRRSMGNPGPPRGMLTRYRATPSLLAICAEHDVTPQNVREHFKFVPVMPSELVQLTKPHHATPETPETHRLRADVAALNAFMREHTLIHPTQEIVHLGWVRKFHQAEDPKAYRWDKGGRLYSYPQDHGCYQQIEETERVQMLIDGAPVAEVDISSSYLTIFYAWIEHPLDIGGDAYASVLGPTKLDRIVTKFFINHYFGKGDFLTSWRSSHVATVQKILKKKGMAPEEFNPKRYNLREVRRRVLEHHPLLERWSSPIGGRARNWGDLMYAESEVVIGSMKELMTHGVPSLPVHDSLLVPTSHQVKAVETLTRQFQTHIGVAPSLDVTLPPQP
ncbi:hypothetical protein IVB27_21965 [Bradyrhizobium sp. 197]|uniref:hypothetical protein n=1 Tax=Bradyrhizobium sp. 197 TaxID=2782663 RepID=UPI001FFC0F3F|nr:hypothetical protein [Bradyrhizobium sp. 197]MCK1477398.1 hypothetical protein [Bradyrhizobium sp. 197]